MCIKYSLMNYNTRQKQLTSEELNTLIKEYRETTDEKIIHKIYFADIAFYKTEARKRSYIDFDTCMSLIYQSVRHAVNKYDKDKGTFLSYARIWISKYCNEYVNSLEIVKVKEEKVYYVSDDELLNKEEEIQDQIIDYSILTEQEAQIVKLYYLESMIAKKICEMLNLKLWKFFAIKIEAVNKIRRNLK